jgi:arsenate reductase
MSETVIYHNPKCGTSRNTLALIRNAGIEPQVIEYLQTPLDRQTLMKLLRDASLTPRELIRSKETIYTELKLDEPHWSDDQLIDLMVANPILINRPIVVTPLGTRLCRPSELVLDILASAQRGPFTKEDGEVVVDANGKRVK